MAVINQVLNSYKKFLYSITNLGAYIYTDSSINIDDTIVARSKVDLPLGTEVTFIIQGEKNSVYSDIITTSDDTFLLNKYIMFTSPTTSAISYKRIIDYNNLTGSITIDSAFGEALVIANTFQIVTQYSIYINGETIDDLGNSNEFNETAIRFYMDIKTKKDSKKENINNIIESIKSEIGKYRNLPVYNEALTAIVAYANFEDNGRYNITVDKADQLIQYLGTTRIHFYVDNFGG